jgi:DNA-binding CsgD family transcriptional regulator/N-acetylneuraminic acid mutarotase
MTDKTELSEREIEILKLVATGASNKEIGQRLYISSNTVKVHLRNIFGKIGVESRTEAAMYAVNAGLITDRSPANIGAETLASGEPAGQLVVVEPGQNQDLAVSNGVLAAGRRPKLTWWVWLVIAVTLLGVSAGLFWFLSPQGNENPVITIGEESDRWSYTTPLSVARAGLAVATLDNQLYAIGGTVADGVSPANERYDPAARKWESLAAKPTPTSDISAVVIGGKIYVPGGRLANDDVTPVLEIFDPRLNRWEEGAPLPEGRSAYGLAAFEGKFYLFGGWNGQEYVDNVYEYDPGQDQWNEKASLDVPRGFLAAVQAAGKIFVIGGYDGKRIIRTVAIYSPELDDGENDPWSEKTALPAGRYQMGAVGLADSIYILGGIGTEDQARYALNYNPQLDQWSEFETPVDVSWTLPGVASLGNYIYGVGGLLAGELTGQNLAYQAIYTILLPVVR